MAIIPVLEAPYVCSMGDMEAEDVRGVPEHTFRGAFALKEKGGGRLGETSSNGPRRCRREQ